MVSDGKVSATQRLTVRRLAAAGAVSAGLAAAVNLAIYFIGGSLFAIDYVIPPPQDSADAFVVSPANVVLDTVIMALAATLVFGLFNRVSARPARLFLMLAAVVLALSFIFPLLLPVELPMKLCLSLMHTAAAAIIVTCLLRAVRA